ncbi:MAG: glycosyltransferase family 2 protein [Lachnospiraceae bacterium]|nr:glycosyltransferase family 2 protein [Lachnospiraceae bacterium]
MVFSIITPFYKGNAYIGNIYSVAEKNAETLKQAFPESTVELIVVNDSPDETVTMPDPSDQYSFRLLNHSVNQGIHQARVTGLMESTGDYILFLDQDDEVADDFLLDQYRKIDDADMIIACAYYEDGNGKGRELYNTPGKIRKLTTYSTYLKSHDQIASPGQCLIRRTSIPKEWTENIMTVSGADDFFLWILMFEKHQTFAVNKRCLYTHKNTGINLSESGVAMSKSSLSFVPFLRKIPYVSKEHIDTLERSRKMDIAIAEASLPGKLMAAVKNTDIILHRVIWKIRCL